MGWARIVIELEPERHDLNEVMLKLADMFSNDEGVPTATVTLDGVAPEPPQTIVGSSFSPVPSSGTQLRYPYTQADLDRAAESIVRYWGGGKKIQAIKELRGLSNLGLKESKDAIDKACQRLGI